MRRNIGRAPEVFDEIDHKVRVHYGLVEETEYEEAADVVEESAATNDNVDEVVLDLDDAIEIEE